MMSEPKPFPAGKEQGPSIEAAKLEIEAIRQEIYMMGANDAEFNELATVLKAMESGTCLPEQAVEEARKIRDKKMDYH